MTHIEDLAEHDAADREESANGEAKTKEAGQLAALKDIVDGFELFRGSDGKPYIEVVSAESGKQTLEITGSSFKEWLNFRSYERLKKPLSDKTFEQFIKAQAATAMYANPADTRAIYTRVGEASGAFYLNLSDAKNRAVEIDAAGWRILDVPPVAFRSSSRAKAIPTPARGGSIDLLRPFVNVGSEADFALVVGWVIGTFRPSGPYPILVLQGEQGSSKSTLARLLKMLVDPAVIPLRAMPGSEDALLIAAQSSHVLAFDNISKISPDTADQLCRLATGGGIAKRRLYTDDDEFALEATRPVILNGIDYLAERPDLVSRAIIVHLRRIEDFERKTEAELIAQFEDARPLIVGALLDAVVYALSSDLDISTLQLPRMADYAAFVAKAEDGLRLNVSLLEAYRANNSDSMRIALDSDALAETVFMLLDTTPTEVIEASPTELLRMLEANWRGHDRRQIPANAQALSSRLERLAPGLKEEGVIVERLRMTDKTRTRRIRISLAPGATPSWGDALSDAERVFNGVARAIGPHPSDNGER